MAGDERGGMAQRRRRSWRDHDRGRSAEAASRVDDGSERWRRPRARTRVATPPEPVGPPPPVRRLLVEVDGSPVEVGSLRVEGEPSPQELLGSLATLGLDDLDAEVRASQAALAASLRVERSPRTALLRALAVARRVLRWRGWPPVAGLVGFAAALVVLCAPIWVSARRDVDLRGELEATALLTGAGAFVLVGLPLSLTIEPRRPTAAPAGRPGVGAGGVLLMVGLLVWMLVPIVVLVVRTSSLSAWQPGIVAGLAVHAAALVAWVVLLIVLRRGPIVLEPAAHAPSARTAPPEQAIVALERTFRGRLAALDAGDWTALRSAVASQTDRLVASGTVDAGARAAMLRVGPTGVALDAALAARLAHDPSVEVVLRPHLPVPVVAAVIGGRPRSAGLVRRVVREVAGERLAVGLPFDAAVLVDLVAAARVPILARDRRLAIALSRLWPTVVLAGWGTALGSLAATLAWLPEAAAFREPTSPSAAVAFAWIAAVLLALVDVRERVGSLRARPTTLGWIATAACAGIAASLVAGAGASSPYLRGLRAGDVAMLAVVALVALAAGGWRVAEALGGRRHDAVHPGSAEWPLSRARAAQVEADRRRRALVQDALLDEVADELEPALRLAVDLGRLDAAVLNSVATAARRASWSREADARDADDA
ncbi:hypothetical protein [Agrococcus sp. SGAir0287]|uniref:hypothetical protein n=1 Tax=Agrococcus sp. SGAir0287 TaxID=2070347 RepID=UPI0010CCC8BA|nr:hypothetical protein [Agrococcus sp. SGAir0287]QCR19488.1 hypothetical protein C1N71_08655 [Agrococcus sp. SGAir0287]